MRAVMMTIWLLGWAGSAAAEGLQLSPPSATELEAMLQKLNERHGQATWCTQECATFYEVRLGGALARGELSLSFSGMVNGEARALVPLVGLRPNAGLDALADARGRRLPLYWLGDAYAVVLEPGEFVLRGTAAVARNAAVTVALPGPIGRVEIAVADAEVVGTGERRGVRSATYQLTPRREATATESSRDRLRLQISRTFGLAREQTFSVSVSARGAKPGQVIRLPLAAAEQVEELDEAVATVRQEGEQRFVDWVAPSSAPSFTYAGKWKGESIALVAPPGAVKETWRVRCDDPYACTFTGDAETATGEQGHVWAPLPGQALKVSWTELAPLVGVHTVAQDVMLASRPIGRNLHQRLEVAWLSSSGSLVAVTLPPEALISRFTLDGAPLPVLKDERGAIRVSLPAGTSRLAVAWELAGAARSWLRPPVPQLSEPVATLWHRIYRAEGETVIKTGGMAGAPRVALWPALGACLVLAGLLWLLGRWGKAPIGPPALFWPAFGGFAILHPIAALPLALALGLGRWLSRIRAARGRFRVFVELSTWAVLVIVAVVVIFVTLHHALFSADPLEVTSFVGGGGEVDGWGYDALVWGAFLAGDAAAASALPSPWALMIPVVWVRLLWAAWAVVTALFLVKEGRLALAQLGSYWQAARATKPAGG